MSRLVSPGGRGEEGFTLLEGMVVLVVLAVLIAITIPIVSTVYQTTDRVDNTYSNLDAQLELSTTFQRLLRAAVAPAPPLSGAAPTTGRRTPFKLGTMRPTSITFYANIGTANGPAEVVAGCSATTTTHAYLCKPTSRFTITIISASPGTCPTNDPTSSTPPKTCTYPASRERELVSIDHLQNGTDDKPLFVYAYGIQPELGTPLSVTTVCVTTTRTPATCTGSDTRTLDTRTSCTAATSNASNPYASCPAGAIDDVVYDLQVNAKTTATHPTQTTALHGGLAVEDYTGTFVLSATSMLYDPAVG